jgi:hypothetical protein
MQNQTQPQLFAFKLAEQRDKDSKQHPAWQVRDGVAVAGCSGPDGYDNYRAASAWGVADGGIYC